MGQGLREAEAQWMQIVHCVQSEALFRRTTRLSSRPLFQRKSQSFSLIRSHQLWNKCKSMTLSYVYEMFGAKDFHSSAAERILKVQSVLAQIT
ncbi:hypothetical protein TNIN_323431 [Trichonephila inaurata madagascariensis]|uniref:Uncharacterized protein n=1 Tax=Trichonephila inaurata madagascariensis TaxID=2747483 RepID=A0A8X6Y9L3_9ARAC|nr:hypothetical protein TNIN_323431 [Trichonephila inaurata madagascariensis]